MAPASPMDDAVALICPCCRAPDHEHALDEALRCPCCGAEHASVRVDDGPRVAVLLQPDDAGPGLAATERILERLDAGPAASVQVPTDEDAPYLSALSTFGGAHFGRWAVPPLPVPDSSWIARALAHADALPEGPVLILGAATAGEALALPVDRSPPREGAGPRIPPTARDDGPVGVGPGRGADVILALLATLEATVRMARGGSIGCKLGLAGAPRTCATSARTSTSRSTTPRRSSRPRGPRTRPPHPRSSSYLFGDEKVHLNDLYERRTNETEEYWTDPKVPGKRFGAKKPIYVLTSSQTFSAAEEFAYNLRSRKRATIVGETTGGGAHPVDGIRVDDHVLAVVPIARAVNPVTKTNWEGKGVEPHVAVPASEALERAKALIAGGK